MANTPAPPTAQIDLDRQMAATSDLDAIQDLIDLLEQVVREPRPRWFGFGTDVDDDATVALSSAAALMIERQRSEGGSPPPTPEWIEVTSTLRIFLSRMGSRPATAVADRLVEVVVDWARRRPMGNQTDLLQVYVYGPSGRTMRTIRIHMRLERLVDRDRQAPPVDLE